MRLCNCGSGKASRELCDARGIYVSRVCDACERKVRSQYRLLAATLRDLGLVKVRGVLGEDEQELVALAEEILCWTEGRISDKQRQTQLAADQRAADLLRRLERGWPNYRTRGPRLLRRARLHLLAKVRLSTWWTENCWTDGELRQSGE